MFSAPAFFRIQDTVPGHWTARRITSVSVAVTGCRSTHLTPADALVTVQQTQPDADFEIHVRADDMTAPVEVRAALLKLRKAGIVVARRPYERTFEQFSQIGLTEDDLKALIYEKPFFGTPAARLEVVDSQRKVVLELAIVVVGDLP